MAARNTSLTVSALSAKSPNIKIETLVPDFRGRMDRALDILKVTPPDVFNHNRKTYRVCIAGASGRRLQLVAEAAGAL